MGIYKNINFSISNALILRLRLISQILSSWCSQKNSLLIFRRNDFDNGRNIQEPVFLLLKLF